MQCPVIFILKLNIDKLIPEIIAISTCLYYIACVSILEEVRTRNRRRAWDCHGLFSPPSRLLVFGSSYSLRCCTTGLSLSACLYQKVKAFRLVKTVLLSQAHGLSQAWWHIPLIPTLSWISEFKASLIYWVSSRTAQKNLVSKSKQVNKNKTKNSIVEMTGWNSWSYHICNQEVENKGFRMSPRFVSLLIQTRIPAGEWYLQQWVHHPTFLRPISQMACAKNKSQLWEGRCRQILGTQWVASLV